MLALSLAATTLTALFAGVSAQSPPPGHDLFACALAGIGDVDGDGLADLLIGDDRRWSPGPPPAFAVAVSPARERALFSVGTGEERLATRRSLVGLADVNGDECPDFAAFLRVEEYELASFEVGLYSGKDGSPMERRRLVDQDRIDYHETCMRDAGDFDGDGLADLLISGSWGPSLGERPRRSRVWVLSAATLEVLLELEPQEGDPPFLAAAAGMGDVDGDGHPDLAITLGDPQYLTGRMRLVSGVDGALIPGWQAAERTWNWPDQVTLVDQDGDGAQDLLVLDLIEVSPYVRQPRISSLSGRTGKVLWTRRLDRKKKYHPHLTRLEDLDGDGLTEVLLCDHDSLGPGCALVLDGETGAEVHEIQGEDVEPIGDHFGYSAAALGDADGDGVADFAVGAANWWSKTLGFVDVFSGKDARRLLRIYRTDVMEK